MSARAIDLFGKARQAAANPAIRASMWSVGGLAAQNGFRLASNLILTRLLVPEAFGLMSLIIIIIFGLNMLTDVGIDQNIIRSEKGEDPNFVDTAWTVKILRGLLIFFIVCGLANPIAWFYEEPQLVQLMPVVGLLAVFASFNSTALTLASRRLWLGRETILNLSTQLLGIIVMVVWAIVAPSVWALVAGSLVDAFVKAIASHFVFPEWRNRFRWNPTVVKELINFGKWIFVSSLLTFFAGQLDRLTLGKLVSFTLVGVYSIGFMWGHVPLLILQAWANKVFYALASAKFREGGDPENQIITLRRRINGIVALGIAVFFAAAGPMFVILYEEEYWGGVPILQISLIGVWLQILETTYQNLVMVHGNMKFLAGGQFLSIVAFLGSVLPLSNAFGSMYGVAAAFVVGRLALYVVMAVGARQAGHSDLRWDALITGALVAAALGLNFVVGWAGFSV